MKTNISTILGTAAAAALLAGTVMVADAGRGASYGSVVGTINNGGTASIIAELERAERLVCPGCVDAVMPLLEDERYQLREAAAWWFARRPAHKAMLTDRSIDHLVAGDSVQVRNAADILGTFRHPQAIGPLADAYNRTDLSVEARAHVVFALGTIGDKAANPVIEAAMSDESADVRLQAVTAWVEMRRQSDAGQAVTLVNDSNVLVRRKAAAAVGFFGDADGRLALEDRLVNDDDPVVRRNAAWALGQIGDAASLSVLDQATDDESSLVRATARAAKRSLR